MSYVIAGVSGKTGKAAAEALLNAGKSVRVVVRDEKKGEAWRARGAEVAVADLSDAAAMSKALQGAEGAYLLLPPNYVVESYRAYQDQTSAALSEAVAASGVPHVVFLSSAGAEQPSGTGPITGLYVAEKAFSQLQNTRFSFLRAGFFMENFATSLGMLDQGVLPSFLPADMPLDYVATEDIGGLAAQLLVEGTDQNQVVELGGPPQTMNEAAAVLSTLLGRSVAVHVAPFEAVVPALTSAGMSPNLASLYEEMFRATAEGRVKFLAGNRRLPGKTRLEDVLKGLLAAR